MRISICVICYNYGRFLSDAITSCLYQDGQWDDLEVLVLDDGSTDETPEICARFEHDPRVRISRTENRGFGATLTRGIREAKGDFVFLLDADDRFLPQKLQSISAQITDDTLYVEHPKRVIDASGNPVTNNANQRSGQAAGSTSTIGVRRDAALAMLPVENEIGFHPLKHIGPALLMDQPLVDYRIHGNSMLDRESKGAWYFKLGGMTQRVADRLVALSGQAPTWTSADQLTQVAAHFRMMAAFDWMEAALQERRWLDAYRHAGGYLKHAFAARALNAQVLRHALRVARRKPIPQRSVVSSV
ncbi:MAG: glycosyltransferase family 2 protein [Planctomycetota bacterium]